MQHPLEQILWGKTIEDKLTPIHSLPTGRHPDSLPRLPGREPKIQIQETKMKFPKQLEKKENQARAIHFFANHELQAIEMMAGAILMFAPLKEENLHKWLNGILASLKDEQRHFSLYLQKLNALGFEFGDFPLNDFFWKQMPLLNTPARFACAMNLTFESANIDFMHYYGGCFSQIGAHELASLLFEIAEDEISHVRVGTIYLKGTQPSASLWKTYLENLPFPLTPARAKGQFYLKEERRKCGWDAQYIEHLGNYNDSFPITTRRTWNTGASL